MLLYTLLMLITDALILFAPERAAQCLRAMKSRKAAKRATAHAKARGDGEEDAAMVGAGAAAGGGGKKGVELATNPMMNATSAEAFEQAASDGLKALLRTTPTAGDLEQMWPHVSRSIQALVENNDRLREQVTTMSREKSRSESEAETQSFVSSMRGRTSAKRITFKPRTGKGSEGRRLLGGLGRRRGTQPAAGAAAAAAGGEDAPMMNPMHAAGGGAKEEEESA